MAELSKPFRIMALPQELRDKIWELAVPTETIAISAHCTKPGEGDFEWRFYFKNSNKNDRLGLVAISSLRQTCKQINTQVQEAFSKYANFLITAPDPTNAAYTESKRVPASTFRHSRRLRLAAGMKVKTIFDTWGFGSEKHPHPRVLLNLADRESDTAFQYKTSMCKMPQDSSSYDMASKYDLIVREAISAALKQGLGTEEILQIAFTCMLPYLWSEVHDFHYGEHERYYIAEGLLERARYQLPAKNAAERRRRDNHMGANECDLDDSSNDHKLAFDKIFKMINEEARVMPWF